MRKLIAITYEIVKSIKIMAVNKDCDLKNYIQDVVINHVKNNLFIMNINTLIVTQIEKTTIKCCFQIL